MFFYIISRPGYPGVYTKVANLKTWILREIVNDLKRTGEKEDAGKFPWETEFKQPDSSQMVENESPNSEILGPKQEATENAHAEEDERDTPMHWPIGVLSIPGQPIPWDTPRDTPWDLSSASNPWEQSC